VTQRVSVFESRLRRLCRTLYSEVFREDPLEGGEAEETVLALRLVVAEMRDDNLPEPNVRLALGGAMLAELFAP
jgi:hypothetical protein